jgi:Fe-S oxidoreductase
MQQGKLELDNLEARSVTFHDPCYLGRQNGVYDDPRHSLKLTGMAITEMPRSRANSFCCGAGGAQMWKEEEDGEMRVSSARVKEASETGADTLVVGCPFCMLMLDDAVRTDAQGIEIRDVAEVVSERLKDA